MSIAGIGSLGSYMKNFKLQTQWQMKKESGDLLSKKKSLEEWIADTTNSLLKSGEIGKNSGNVDVEALYMKIQSGKKLSSAEKDYLRTHDPQMYEKVKSIERERKAYEEEIKRCKTKEDVQRAKFTRISASLSSVKSVENNPNIPMGQKLAHAVFELAKVRAVEEITLKFVESGEYAKLPTDAEYAEAMKEMNEERKPEAAQKEEEKKTEGSEETKADKGDDGDVILEEENAQKKETVVDKETAVVRQQKAGRLNRVHRDFQKNIEVESDELRKAKRAKAKAAYQKISGEWEASDSSPFQNAASFDAKG